MQMYNLVEKPIILEDVPILASFTEEKINGVAGDRRHMVAFIRNVLLQLIVTHSYDDVKVVFLADACDVEELEFVKYIPHIWNDQRTFRFLACDVTEAYSISEYLKRELENDLDSPRALKEILKQHPYYVFFALDKKIFDSMEILKGCFIWRKTSVFPFWLRLTVFQRSARESFSLTKTVRIPLHI